MIRKILRGCKGVGKVLTCHTFFNNTKTKDARRDNLNQEVIGNKIAYKKYSITIF